MNNMQLSCPYGVMTGIVENGVGINKENAEIRDACLVDDAKFGNKNCSDKINMSVINDFFTANCINKNSCDFGW